jgi:hypothetical protein
MIDALETMNGKYIGFRPCKLKKSTWKDLNNDNQNKKMKKFVN